MSNVISDEQRQKRDLPEPFYLPAMNNVLVYRFKAEDKTKGGIIMPDTAKPVYSRGILLAMGLQAYDKLSDALIEVGDEVFLAHYAGRDRDEAARQAGQPPVSMVELKAEDVLGSIEAKQRVKDYTIGLDDDGNSMYQRKGA